jgi:hypothetical protein
MADLALALAGIPAMSDAAIENVRRPEKLARGLPQVALETNHVIHAGLYARTPVHWSRSRRCWSSRAM